jgi:hypothetical protein
LSTTEPCSEAWIWGCIKPKNAGMLSCPVLVTSPPVCGDKTTPTRNDCIAWLGLIVGSWVQVLARVDLKRLMGTGLTPKKVIKQAFPTTVAGLVGLNQLAVKALSTTAGYNAYTGKYCIICPGGKKKKSMDHERQHLIFPQMYLDLENISF